MSKSGLTILMRLYAIAFLVGIFIFLQLPALPDSRWSLAIFLISPIIFYTCRQLSSKGLPLLFILICFLGFLWALLRASLFFSLGGLTTDQEGKELIAEGVVVSMPILTNHKPRFEFDIHSLNYQGKKIKPIGRVQLSWYNGFREVKLGERWRFLVKLKRPHGFMNPGGFDYEAWLFHKGIHATGYIKNKLSKKEEEFYPGTADKINKRLATVEHASLIKQFRQHLSEKISLVLASNSSKGLIKALAIGDRQDITPAQWRVLTRTGTNHLMAISGLHIGLVAGFVFFLMKWGWRWVGYVCNFWLLPRCCLYLPANKFAAVFALVAAAFYAMLAGFSIPTQRALVMVALVMLSIFFQRVFRPSVILAVALMVILIIDPFSVMDAGFWLSFSAVAIILFCMSSRLYQKSIWWKWGRVQWIVAIGLTPLLLILFQKTTLISPVANLIAVPWVSLIIVPLTLIGSLVVSITSDISDAVGALLLNLAARSFDLLWFALDGLANLPFATWHQHAPVAWTVIPGLLGILWLLMPRGVPVRWVGVIGLMPMVLVKPPVPKDGDFLFTLLDVGQGLSAVVQTRHHVLVYDTGPRFSERFNTGSAVVVPFLNHRGIDVVDMLLISHGDNDHIGGMESIMEEMDVKTILTSVPQEITYSNKKRCANLQSWHWDNVKFDIISPPTEWEGGLQMNSKRSKALRNQYIGNNGSCVLKITNMTGSVLLTGDIEKSAENYLLRDYINAEGSAMLSTTLSADVLVVPHHGSKTSSTLPFVTAVWPKYALFPVGYRNRFGLPRTEVVDRYRAVGARVIDTAKSGAIEFSFFQNKNQNQDQNTNLNSPILYRKENRRFFNQ
ncbi:MAG: DNA internalization-related competence protein ComEC/Rec2 [Gammaproteobacteria bacterium]|nr:DNA internalization-related competence protein ComEC/Rec2 [Gammaproteobacteria bacterium]